MTELDDLLKSCDEIHTVNFLKETFTRNFGGSRQKSADDVYIVGSINLKSGDGRHRPVLCCYKDMDGVLTARSSRKKQFDMAAKVLKANMTSPYMGNGPVTGGFTQGLFFFADREGNFRLSLVTADISNKKMELNNYRRQSFFVEAGQRNNTFRTRLGKKISTFDELKAAFDVEKLSDDFFREYKVFYEDIVQYVTGARFIEVKKNKYERKEMSAPCVEIFQQFSAKYGEDAEKAVRNYVKKMMGRLVFIQFVQKKGWLGIKQGESGWNGGDHYFLQNLVMHPELSEDDRENFVDNILEVIFFNAFNTKESERKIANKLLKQFKFPFLNCGLFDRDEDDKLDFKLPIEVFHSIKFQDTERKAPDVKNWTKKRKAYFNEEACGLFDFFDRYNFTIDENDPSDADVSVDPEMLGKIFENLLEDNKDKGAFYTPKEIVSYMCNESLIAYLESELALTHPEQTTCIESTAVILEAPRADRIQTLSLHDVPFQGDRGKGHPERSEGTIIRSLVVNQNVELLSEKQKADIDKKLAEVKICDPAIGSGAFPMGLLNLLCKCRRALNPIDEETDTNAVAKFKREIIQNNIYGVDIEKGAVDIAQLRFWLSLVVDETTPEALPNLEYKIMQGNSLLESYEGIPLDGIAGEKAKGAKTKDSLQTSMVFDEKGAMDQIQKDLNSFFNTDSHSMKESLRESINLNVRNYIKHRSQYSRYAEIEKLPLPNDKFFLWHTYFRDVFDRKGKSGFDIVIGNPPYLLCQPSNTDENLLNFYKENFSVASYKIDLFHLFFEEGIELLKSNGILSYITPNTYLTNKYIKPLREFILDNCDVLRLVLHDKVFESAQVDNATIVLKKCKQKNHEVIIEKCEKFVYRIKGQILQNQWENDLDKVFNVEKKFSIESEKSLGDIASVTFGLQTADKKTFVKESNQGSGWEPCYTGKNVNKYFLPNPELFFLNNPAKVKAGGSWDMNIHHSKKLVTRQIGAPEPFFALDSKGIATLNTMYSIVIKEKNYSEKFVLGICNSLLIKYWWLSRFSDNKALFPKIKGFQLKQIPIPTATPTQQQPIISLVDSILAAKKKDPSADTSKQEAEIDRLVYKLYDLTDEEIAIVEGRDSIASLQNDNVVGKLQNDHNVKELQNDNVAKDLQNNVVGELQNDCTKKSPATASNDSWLQGEEL